MSGIISKMDTKIRINKYLATQGIASRRGVDELISQGKITINGKIAKPGDRVDVNDIIFVEGKQVISANQNFTYIILNKPKGVISTAEDEFGRKTVVDFVKSRERLYPVGRLDENSTGLILLTNDGDLTYRLTHPKYHIPKTYELLIQGSVSADILEKFATGVELKDGITSPAQVEVLWERDNRTLLRLTIHEGWYHQIRRMCAALNLELIDLKRVSIGFLKLGSLPTGKSRILKTDEILQLKKEVGIA